VKKKWLWSALAAAIVLALAPVAPVAARDFNIAGGIQYVSQGMKEKEKGNLEDAHRIFGKAVTTLTKGIANDPKDDEAWIYLAVAYGELDSLEQSGKTFSEAIRRVADDPKLLKRATDNRDSYFNKAYNDGIAAYKEATAILPAEEIPASTDEKGTAAKAKLAVAEQKFRSAMVMNPEKAIAYDNLAIMLALQGNMADAGAVVEQGLANAVPKEGEDYERLLKRKDSMYNNAVAADLEKGDFDAAIAKLEVVLAKTPDDFGVLTNVAQTTFKKAEKLGEAKDEAGAKAAFAKAAGYFERASAAAPDSQNKKDMLYNGAIAHQQAGEYKEAATAAFALVQEDPQSLDYHRLLRTGYDKMGAQKKADEQTWVILGKNEKAEVVGDIPGFVAKVTKTSEPGKVLTELGPPDEIRQFTNGDLKVDVWYWWTKKRAVAFTGGRQVGAANFGEFAADAPPPATKNAGATKKD
jgi:tetratricopeptide (TPR) repeat protein